MFKLDDAQLPTKAKSVAVKNALYADIYTEFLDAQYNSKYSSMDLIQRMQAVNDFAHNWLQTKGFV
jgi:hypothetical protein